MMTMTTNTSPCFFCSQDSRKYFKAETESPKRNEPEPVSTINLFCLQNISRFLSLFEKYEDNDDENSNGRREKFKDLRRKLLEVDNDCVVPVCEHCSEYTKEFSDLHDVLLEAKRMLESCVQKMHDVISKSTNNKHKRGDYEIDDVGVADDSEEVTETMTMGGVTEVTVTQSQVAFPKRLKKKRIILHREDDRTKIDDPLEPLTPPCISDDNEDYPLNPANMVVAELERNPEPPQLRIKNPQSSNEITDSDSCSYCRYEPQEKSSFSGTWMLRQHTLQYHIEHYFPNARLDSVSDTQYKKILSELLFKHLITGNGCCSFCDKSFPGSKGNVKITRIKSHLVESHHSALKEKLMLIQRDPNLLITLTNCNPHGIMCECGVYLSDKESQTNHNLFCKGPKLLVPAVPKKSRKLRKKMKTKQKTAPFSDHLSFFTPTTSDKEKVTCKLCNKIMKRKSTLWHYTYSCRKGLLRCPPGTNFTALVNQGSPFSCNYCRKEFAGQKRANLLIHHWIRFHPEHFFLDEMNNLNSVTKHQFQLILHNILFPEVQSEDYVSCILCDKNYSFETKSKKKYLLRKHVLYNHNSILRKRLETILNDPKLLERLDSSSSSPSSSGMSCHCGMYIQSRSTCSKSHHDKYHCKLASKFIKVKLTPEWQNVVNQTDEFTLDSEDEVNEVKVSGNVRNKRYGYPAFFDNAKSSINACPFCRAQMVGKIKFRRHLFLYHCKHLFPHHKLDFVGDSDFQKILVELLFKDLDCSSSGEKRCQFCDLLIRDIGWEPMRSKVHYFMKHYKELEKILADIQNDPDLTWKLKRCNPSGKICDCGIYVGSERALVGHQRTHCVMTAGGNDKLEFLDGHRGHDTPPPDIQGPEIITINDDDDDEEVNNVGVHPKSRSSLDSISWGHHDHHYRHHPGR